MKESKKYEDDIDTAPHPELEFKYSDYLPFYKENILYTTVLKNFR